MTIEEIYENAKRKLDKNEITIGEFAEIVDVEVGQSRWIPVSERLPKDGTWNIFTDGKTISVERYKSDAIDHFFPDGRWFSLEEAVAWMPLPEPMKVGEENADSN